MTSGEVFPCDECDRVFRLPDDQAEALDWMLEHLDGHLHDCRGPWAARARDKLLDLRIDLKSW